MGCYYEECFWTLEKEGVGVGSIGEDGRCLEEVLEEGVCLAGCSLSCY
jgi:hypothetical protein